jgi:hypothetical protein
MSDEVTEKQDYDDTPVGQYKRWNKELTDAKEWFRHFQKKGEKVVKAYLDDRKDTNESVGVTYTKLNLFHANITTLMSMLYGRIPKVEVTRRFADADDDVARVAGEMATRILNNDIEVAGEDVASVFRSGLQDRLIPGLGSARVRYQYESSKETIPAITHPETGEEQAPSYEQENITDEWVDIVYTHWKDLIWSPCRIYSEIRWKAYRSYMGKDEFKERFPKAKLDKVTFSTKGPLSKPDSKGANYQQAEIWEIWDKSKRCVYWYTEGYQETLDHKEDPLELEGFWPDPPPLVSNVTTTKYLPKSDYEISQDLYREIDELETRITLLTQACKCVGVYDKANEGVQRIFNEGVENQLIPVENWGQFSEKGGLKGSIDWVPIEEVANVIGILSQKQQEKIQQLYQVTGMNDVMRGAAQTEGTPVSATERKIQANYGSIRIEALQNEFARWVSDIQQLKLEIICKHYQPECIIQQSNIKETMDGQNPQTVEAAIQLLKDPAQLRWRVNVRPESLAIADYAQLKQDRTEYLFGLAQFMQSAAPMIEQKPESAPYLLQLLKWGMAGFRGSSEIEGIFDQAINALQKTPPQQKPDPEAEKAKAEMQMKQMEMQAKMQMEKEKHASEMQANQQKNDLEMKKLEAEFAFMQKEFDLKFQMMQAELGAKLQEKEIETAATQKEQEAQFAYNTAERQQEAKFNQEDREHEAAVAMESGNAELDRDKQRAKLKSKSKPNGDAGS